KLWILVDIVALFGKPVDILLDERFVSQELGQRLTNLLTTGRPGRAGERLVGGLGELLKQWMHLAFPVF
ncbi:MAG: hypothetical protein ACO3FM_06640, partial [Burkholderiaceae bacterium]